MSRPGKKTPLEHYKGQYEKYKTQRDSLLEENKKLRDVLDYIANHVYDNITYDLALTDIIDKAKEALGNTKDE